ncbi:DNA adenine methylase [Candidatus Roizmanbacteria bacterium]|nr:MAG: DNA adenine methylase [Candidatus Roizmanbacteria bacterium]
MVKNDFVYFDPPYLLGLASYNELGGWTENDERDLYALLTRLNDKGIRFALSNVLEHKGEINKIIKAWANKGNSILQIEVPLQKLKLSLNC